METRYERSLRRQLWGCKSIIAGIICVALWGLAGHVFAAEAPDWRQGAALIERCNTDPEPGCDSLRSVSEAAVALCDRVLGAWDEAGRPVVRDARVAQRLFDCLDMRDSGLEEALRGATRGAKT